MTRMKRKWGAHAISYAPEILLLPSVGVLYLPTSYNGHGDVRPGQVWVSLRFLSFSVAVGFYFWPSGIERKGEL